MPETCKVRLDLGSLGSKQVCVPLPVQPFHVLGMLRVFKAMIHPSKKTGSGAGIGTKERRSLPRYAFSAMAEAVELQSDTESVAASAILAKADAISR